MSSTTPASALEAGLIAALIGLIVAVSFGGLKRIIDPAVNTPTSQSK